jgi:hypothetical protein
MTLLQRSHVVRLPARGTAFVRAIAIALLALAASPVTAPFQTWTSSGWPTTGLASEEGVDRGAVAALVHRESLRGWRAPTSLHRHALACTTRDLPPDRRQPLALVTGLTSRPLQLPLHVAVLRI